MGQIEIRTYIRRTEVPSTGGPIKNSMIRVQRNIWRFRKNFVDPIYLAKMNFFFSFLFLKLQNLENVNNFFSRNETEFLFSEATKIIWKRLLKTENILFVLHKNKIPLNQFDNSHLFRLKARFFIELFIDGIKMHFIANKLQIKLS